MTLLEASVFARTRVRLNNPLSDVRLQRPLCRPDLLDVGWVGRIFKHQVQMVRAHRQKQGDDAAWERDGGQHATDATIPVDVLPLPLPPPPPPSPPLTEEP